MPQRGHLYSSERIDMIRNRYLPALLTLFTSCTMAPSIAFAQNTVASGATSQAQSEHAQQQLERKARRAKKNAELSELRKKGYNPSGAQVTYPKNLQDAEGKKAPAGIGNPASAP
jgi:hypothetical protein